MGASAVVLVNSQSTRYVDFQHFIQPYLDNFGFPYAVQDIATNAAGLSVTNYAVIIIGHSQLDTNRTYLSDAFQAEISLAVSNGVGLVNFDNDLSAGGIPRYQFVHDIFGFSYGAGSSGANATLPPTEPQSQMHFITARHSANDVVRFRSNLTLPGIKVPVTATTLAEVGGQPLVAITKYGDGRAVQWGSYDWMISTMLGPVSGLDDVVWRGVVWAARKPFVMRGLPNLVTMRVDDASGPFSWVPAANAVGFKPFLALFISDISATSAAELRGLVINRNATASIHAFTTSDFFYFDHQNATGNSDTVQSNNFYVGTQWHLNHGIPMSKVCTTHWSEIGLNCFSGLKDWGIEYVPIEVVPGTIEYSNNAPWVVNGPYRLYEPPQPGQVRWATYYADWLEVPGHPEFDGQFFNIYSEIRDLSSCGEWCPNNDVAGSVSRATEMAKRALDSQVMPTIFTHEWYILAISTGNWQAILQGVTNALGAYTPRYVTLDYANQYVRATRTSRLVNSAFNPESGQMAASFSGKSDLDTQVYVFVGADGGITSTFGNVPAFSMSSNNTVLVSGPPTIISAPSSQTNSAGTRAVFSVGAGGAWPLSYRWYRNGTNALSDGGKVSGTATATLMISNVLGGDAGSFVVVVTNSAGSVTSSPPAVLAVMDPAILSQPQSQNGVAGTTVVFSATASGTSPTYGWLKNGAPIAGATNTALTLTNVSSSDAGSYSLLVSNAYGSVLSSNAILAVYYMPAANNESYSTTAGTTLTVTAPGVLGNDTVLGGSSLTARLVSGPTHGTLNLTADGGFTYTPLTNHVGTDSFTYQAVNGPIGSAAATVTVSTMAAGVLFSDGFARLTDPGPLSPWVAQAGNWAVTGGVLKAGPNIPQSYGFAYLTNIWANYSVEGRVWFPPTNPFGGGIGARLDPATGARYALWIYPEGSPGGPNLLGLIKFRTWTTFGYNGVSGASMEEVSLAATGTNWHTVKLAFQGNQIAAYYDGNQVMSVTDTEAVPYLSGGASTELWTYLLGYTMSFSDMIVRPLVVNDSYSATMNKLLVVPAPGVLGNDTGVSVANLEALLVTGPTNGTLDLSSDGQFTYQPGTNYYGTDSFSYRAMQGLNDLGVTIVTITVMPDVPFIIQAPSSRTNLAGSTAVFSAKALGTLPLGYQWLRNGTNVLNDDGRITGAASAELTIRTVLGGDGGSYTLVVSNVLGSVTTVPPALLSVIDPLITTQPENQTNAAGTTASFRVEAVGTAPRYQWLMNGEPIGGASDAILNLGKLQSGDAGSYSVIVSSVYGSVTSSVATLEVFYSNPTANDDIYSTPEGIQLFAAAPGVLGNDTVPDGFGLTAVPSSWPIHGILTLDPIGEFTYRPLTNYVGTDRFYYRAVNGPSYSSAAAVTVSITAPGVLFSDDFARLTDPGPLSPWVVYAGNWTLANGVLQTGTNIPQSLGCAYLTNTWTDYSLEARVRFSTSDASGGGIGGRLNPATGAHYGLWMYPEGSTGGSNLLRLIKFQTWTNFGYKGSSGLPMQETGLAAPGTNWHTLKLAFQGTQIAAYYDGNQLMSVTDTEAVPYSSGGVSAEMWTSLLDDSMLVDGVAVRPLAADDSYQGYQGEALAVAAPGVLGNDAGIYATDVVATLVSGPTNGTVNLYLTGGFVYNPATSNPGTDSFVYRVSQGAHTVGVATVMIVLAAPTVPMITNVPLSRTNFAGTATVFNAGARGAPPLSYQWFWNGTNALNDGGKVNGARSQTLTISDVLGGDAGSYTVVVSNALGSATSAPPALLTVIDPILTDEPASRTNHAGTTAFFTAGALGTIATELSVVLERHQRFE